MIRLKIEELEKENITLKGQAKIVYRNKSYKRERAMWKKFYDKLLEIVQQYEVDGLNVLVIEHRKFFTIWKEVKPPTGSKESLDNLVNQRLKELGLS